MRLLLCFALLSSSSLAVELTVPLPPAGTDINGNRIPIDEYVEPFYVLEDVPLSEILSGSMSFQNELAIIGNYEDDKELWHLFSIDVSGVSFEWEETAQYDYGHTLITNSSTFVEEALSFSDDGLHFSWYLPGEHRIDGFEWRINDIGFDNAIVDASFSFLGTGPVVVVPEPSNILPAILALLVGLRVHGFPKQTKVF